MSQHSAIKPYLEANLGSSPAFISNWSLDAQGLKQSCAHISVAEINAAHNDGPANQLLHAHDLPLKEKLENGTNVAEFSNARHSPHEAA